jgi:3-hydroxyethyl bacteriochlorophyllide a dehydrogenase
LTLKEYLISARQPRMNPSLAGSLDTLAVVLEAPEHLRLSRLALSPPGEDDVVVDIDYSGISTGTEKLLWTGRMPQFPGMGYPLVPGYESVGRVTAAGRHSGRQVGEPVFVPGARCFGDVRGLFGGAAARVVAPGARVIPLDESIGERGVLLALAATAYHAVAEGGTRERIRLPDLIVGHGVLGRLLARMTVLAGGQPTVWERDAQRAQGAIGYTVLDPQADARRDYRSIYDVSGDCAVLDTLIARMAPGGELVLAGFYSEPLSFHFAPAFMREAQIRVAAEWKRADMLAVKQLVEGGTLSLDGLITHRETASAAERAYRTAFSDVSCLKMVLDWRSANGH